MPAIPLGTLAQSMVARHAQMRIQSDLTKLSMELTTGLTQDVGAATRGDTRALTALTRQIDELNAYGTARAEASLTARSTQTALSSMQDRLLRVQDGVIALAQAQNPTQHQIVAEQARNAFAGVIGDLNMQSAGRSLFGGTALNGPVTRGADAILADIAAAVSGVATPSDLTAAIDAYFAPGGAFETNDYLGSTTDSQPIRIGPQDRAAPTLRADDTAIRDTLKTLATLAVLPDTALSGSAKQLAVDASLDQVINSKRGLIEVQSSVGATEARIEIAASRSAGARAAYETARLDTLAVDPYATATRLQETQTQLETLYTLTARLSGLNLVNFL